MDFVIRHRQVLMIDDGGPLLRIQINTENTAHDS